MKFHNMIWEGRQIIWDKKVLNLSPRNGLFCFLAQLIASILPSVPLTPKPPGTNTPLWAGRKEVYYGLILTQTLQIWTSVYTATFLITTVKQTSHVAVWEVDSSRTASHTKVILLCSASRDTNINFLVRLYICKLRG